MNEFWEKGITNKRTDWWWKKMISPDLWHGNKWSPPQDNDLISLRVSLFRHWQFVSDEWIFISLALWSRGIWQLEPMLLGVRGLWPWLVKKWIFKFIYLKNRVYHLKDLKKLYKGHLNGTYRFLIRNSEILGFKY